MDGPAEGFADRSRRDPPNGPRDWPAQAAAVTGLGIWLGLLASTSRTEFVAGP